MKLSVITPTYNEAENVRPLIAEVQKALEGKDYEVIVADDDSPDSTWAIVEELHATDARVRVLRRVERPGLGPAVVDGFSVAAGDAIACIDADLQHDPAILPQMLELLESGADLVVASRYIEGGGTGDWNALRRFGSRAATRFAQVLLGIPLSDPMAGFFMLRRSDFLGVKEKLNPEGFKILLEIAAQMKPKSVREVAYVFRSRTAGTSKLSSKVITAFVRQVWRLSAIGRLLPGEFLKYAVVGGSGILVNLAVLWLLLSSTGYRDWRASALATLAATITNYVLNNVWTFRDRNHTGFTFIYRYLYFLAISLVAMIVTAGTYTAAGIAFSRAQHLQVHHLPSWQLMLCQLMGIAVGTVINYELNRHLTWPAKNRA